MCPKTGPDPGTSAGAGQKCSWACRQHKYPGILSPRQEQVFEGPECPYHTWEWHQPKSSPAWKSLYHWTLQKLSISVPPSDIAGKSWWTTVGLTLWEVLGVGTEKHSTLLIRLWKGSEDINHTPKEGSTKWNGYACPTKKKKIERERSGMRHQKSTAFFQTESHDQNQFNELLCIFFNGVEWKGLGQNATDNIKVHHL